MDKKQWDSLNKTERGELLRKAGLPSGLSQLSWSGLQKSERAKIEKLSKSKGAQDTKKQEPKHKSESTKGGGKGWREEQEDVLTDKGIEKKAPIHREVAIKKEAAKANNKPMRKPIKKAQHTTTDYLNEKINYGGFVTTRGEAITDMQGMGAPQKNIGAYMMGAKSLPPEPQKKESAHTEQSQEKEALESVARKLGIDPTELIVDYHKGFSCHSLRMADGVFKSKTTFRCPDCDRGVAFCPSEKKFACPEHGMIPIEKTIDLRNIGKDKKTDEWAKQAYNDFKATAESEGFKTIREHHNSMPEGGIKDSTRLGVGLEKIFGKKETRKEKWARIHNETEQAMDKKAQKEGLVRINTVWEKDPILKRLYRGKKQKKETIFQFTPASYIEYAKQYPWGIYKISMIAGTKSVAPEQNLAYINQWMAHHNYDEKLIKEWNKEVKAEKRYTALQILDELGISFGISDPQRKSYDPAFEQAEDERMKAEGKREEESYEDSVITYETGDREEMKGLAGIDEAYIMKSGEPFTEQKQKEWAAHEAVGYEKEQATPLKNDSPTLEYLKHEYGKRKESLSLEPIIVLPENKKVIQEATDFAKENTVKILFPFKKIDIIIHYWNRDDQHKPTNLEVTTIDKYDTVRYHNRDYDMNLTPEEVLRIRDSEEDAMSREPNYGWEWTPQQKKTESYRVWDDVTNEMLSGTATYKTAEKVKKRLLKKNPEWRLSIRHL